MVWSVSVSLAPAVLFWLVLVFSRPVPCTLPRQVLVFSARYLQGLCVQSGFLLPGTFSELGFFLPGTSKVAFALLFTTLSNNLEAPMPDTSDGLLVRVWLQMSRHQHHRPYSILYDSSPTSWPTVPPIFAGSAWSFALALSESMHVRDMLVHTFFMSLLLHLGQVRCQSKRSQVMR